MDLRRLFSIPVMYSIFVFTVQFYKAHREKTERLVSTCSNLMVYNLLADFHVNGSREMVTLRALNGIKNYQRGTRSILKGFMVLQDSLVHLALVRVVVGETEGQQSYLQWHLSAVNLSHLSPLQ